MRAGLRVLDLLPLVGALAGCGATQPSDAWIETGGATAELGGAVVWSIDPSFEPVTVVELFTSEGCASCPPADDFAEALHTQAMTAGVRVFVLAFHVDYWNELGHVDRFSAPRFTERQRWYAEGWGTTRAYTPQLVVGGTEDISGNDRRGALMAVSKQLDQKTKVGIGLAAEAVGSAVRIRYVIEAAQATDYLAVALVQDQADTEIETGTNRGRLLHHVNIVRDFAASHVGTGAGTWTMDVPPDMPSATVVAYVQHARTRRVLGASRLRLK